MITKLNSLNFKQSYPANAKKHRADYVRQKTDEEMSQSPIQLASDLFILGGCLLLAKDKIFGSFKNLNKTDKIGMGILISGLCFEVIAIIKKFRLSSKYIKEFDKQNYNNIRSEEQ